MKRETAIQMAEELNPTAFNLFKEKVIERQQELAKGLSVEQRDDIHKVCQRTLGQTNSHAKAFFAKLETTFRNKKAKNPEQRASSEFSGIIFNILAEENSAAA